MTDLAWINGKITDLDEVKIPPEIIHPRPRRSFFCRERIYRIRSLANLDNDGDYDGGVFDGVRLRMLQQIPSAISWLMSSKKKLLPAERSVSSEAEGKEYNRLYRNSGAAGSGGGR